MGKSCAVNQNRFINFLFGHSVSLFSLVFGAWTLFIMIRYSGYSFWGDEMGTIAIANPIHSVKEMFQLIFSGDSQNGPLFYLAAHFWMKIAPYGTKWLLLINEVAIFFAILLMGQIARKSFGNLNGILCVLLNGVYSFLALQGGYEFRCYAFAYLFSTLTIFAYQHKRLKQNRQKASIPFIVASLLLCYSFFPGALLIAAFFLIDLVDCWKDKKRFDFILPYIFWGVLFFPYFLYAYIVATNFITDFWTVPPLWSDLARLPGILFSNPFLHLLFWLSALMLLRKIIIQLKNRQVLKNLSINPLSETTILWAPVFIVAFIFTYSRLRPEYSMWVPRYFICALPFFLLGMSYALTQFMQFLNGKIRYKLGKGVLWILLGLCFCTLELQYVQDLRASRYPEIMRQPFEQAADFLRQRDDFWDSNTAFYHSGYNIPAWQYYLAHGDMTPKLLNLLSKDASPQDFSKFSTVYVFIVQESIPETTAEFLKANFQEEEIHHDYQIYRYIK